MPYIDSLPAAFLGWPARPYARSGRSGDCVSMAFARGGAIANETTAQLARRILAMWQMRKWVGAAIMLRP